MGVFLRVTSIPTQLSLATLGLSPVSLPQHLLVATCRKKSSSSPLSTLLAFWLLTHA